MTDIVPAPDIRLSSEFPTNADRTAGVFNAKSNSWAITSREMAADTDAAAKSAQTNAIAANERAMAASQSAQDAEQSRQAAEFARDRAEGAAVVVGRFDKLYLGSKSSFPTLDNEGDPLQIGAEFFHAVLKARYSWDGAQWLIGTNVTAGVTQINGATGVVSLKTINGFSIVGDGNIEATPDAVRRPINTSPAQSATVSTESPALVGSVYLSLYGVTMVASQWQVSTVADFATTVVSTGDIAGTATTYTVPADILIVSTTYYWRVRYKDAEGVYSAWSAPTSFTTAASLNSYIATPAATPANFGDPFEGGFYKGMLWNQLVQSATSTAIGTGAKTFTVPSMTGAPIVYAGQQLEVRSRANPVNKMIGVVTGAVGTALTLNITSVSGSGTFADWSIMSRYRMIAAPKASGENPGIRLKNANTAFPAACQTLTEGWAATLAMVAAGDATTYPAAHWARSLVIGGKNDWFLDARDGLELGWRNLKPTTTANYVAADRPAEATANYQNLGSYGGAESTHGLNKNSAPAGAAYTSGEPAQTSATAFKTGGAEAYAFGSAYYWSCSEYDATSAWRQLWFSSGPGLQNSSDKTSANSVRAVRRSII